MFLKGFREEERKKLAQLYGIFFSNGLGNPQCLNALFEDHLVKEGKFVTSQQENVIQNAKIVSFTVLRLGLKSVVHGGEESATCSLTSSCYK